MHTSIDTLHLLRSRTGLKLGWTNRTTECFVLTLRDDDNPRKYCACSEGSCSGYHAALLAFHPWRGALHFESLPVSKRKNYYLVCFIATISDPRLGKVCLRSSGQDVERKAVALRKKQPKGLNLKNLLPQVIVITTYTNFPKRNYIDILLNFPQEYFGFSLLTSIEILPYCNYYRLVNIRNYQGSLNRFLSPCSSYAFPREQ